MHVFFMWMTVIRLLRPWSRYKKTHLFFHVFIRSIIICYQTGVKLALLFSVDFSQRQSSDMTIMTDFWIISIHKKQTRTASRSLRHRICQRIYRPCKERWILNLFLLFILFSLQGFVDDCFEIHHDKWIRPLCQHAPDIYLMKCLK